MDILYSCRFKKIYIRRMCDVVMARIARYRTFCAVGYPETLKEGWQEIIAETHVPCLISPLHEPEDEEKKEHFHLMLDFQGPHAPEDALEIFQSIGAVMEREKNGSLAHVKDKRGYARYFCHLDEKAKGKDKIVYNIDDVTCLNGFDYVQLINLPSDRYSAIGEMIDFIREYNIISFAQLVLYSKENNESWYRNLCDNSAYFMKEFIKSYFWEQNLLAKNECSQNLSFTKNSEQEKSDIV